MTRRILVTGAAGFIGSHLCEHLLSRGTCAVVGIDNFDPFYPKETKLQNIAGLTGKPGWRFETLDIRDKERLGSVVGEAKPDLVVHLAARAGVRPSIVDPEGYVDVNITGTTNLLQACVRHGVTRVAFASSSSVYGNDTPVPFSEDQDVGRPISPYAATKRAGELLCYTYHHVHQLSIACLRFFTVYGPRQRPDLAICKFSRALLAGASLAKFGDGSTCRDYTYIDDIIQGVEASIEFLMEASTPRYEIFNLGNSRTVSLNELIEKLEKHLHTTANLVLQPLPAGDVERTYASIAKANRVLGWSPQTSIDDGLSAFLDWVRSPLGGNR